MGRPPCCDKVGVKKGPWTPEEDIILVSYIQENGPGNWRAVPANTGLLRCSKSCRLRWTNYLRPGIKRGNFTPQEEGMIVHLQSLLGNKWAAIASYLPQRTDNDIKNYWNTHLKKKLKKTLIEPVHSRENPSKELDQGMSKSSDVMFSTSTYASSTQNISRLLEGWMRSSPQKSKASIKANNVTSSTSLCHVLKQEISSNDDTIIHDPFDPLIYENLGNINHKDITIHMSEQRKMKEEVSTPPFSFIEKWLLEEHGNSQIEEVLEFSSIFG